MQVFVGKHRLQRRLCIYEYFQLVLAKFCTGPGQGGVWCSHRFFLDVGTVPFQLELGRGLFSVKEQILVQAPDAETAEEI